MPNETLLLVLLPGPPDSCRADNFRPQIKIEIHLQWHFNSYLGYKRQYFIIITIFLRFLSLYFCVCVCVICLFTQTRTETSSTLILPHSHTIHLMITQLLCWLAFSTPSLCHSTALPPPTAASVLCVIIQLDVSMDFK